MPRSCPAPPGSPRPAPPQEGTAGPAPGAVSRRCVSRGLSPPRTSGGTHPRDPQDPAPPDTPQRPNSTPGPPAPPPPPHPGVTAGPSPPTAGVSPPPRRVPPREGGGSLPHAGLPPGVLTWGSPGAPSASMAGTGWKQREMGGSRPDIRPTAEGLGAAWEPPGHPTGRCRAGGLSALWPGWGLCCHRSPPSAVCPPRVLCPRSGCHRCVPRVPWPPRCHVPFPPVPRVSPQFRVPRGAVSSSVLCHPPRCPVSPSGCRTCPPVPQIPPSATFPPALCPTRVSSAFPSPHTGHECRVPLSGCHRPLPMATRQGVIRGWTRPVGSAVCPHAAWRWQRRWR